MHMRAALALLPALTLLVFLVAPERVDSKRRNKPGKVKPKVIIA